MAAVAIVALLTVERRVREPLLDLRFFRSVPFSNATLIAVCAFAAFAGFLFLNSLYLQEVRGFSAFHTGLYTLPLALATIVCSPLSGRTVGSFGTRAPRLIAGSSIAASALMLTRLHADTPIIVLMLSYVIFGIGFGTVNAPITNTAVSGMPKAQAGLAAAVASTSRQVGASLGVAIAGTISASQGMVGPGFTQVTHVFWWVVTGCGASIMLLGWWSNTPWAKASTRHAAHLLEEAPAGAST